METDKTHKDSNNVENKAMKTQNEERQIKVVVYKWRKRLCAFIKLNSSSSHSHLFRYPLEGVDA